ncbi:MAG: Ig-like domain-containing protein [Planctomycetota bacterium]
MRWVLAILLLITCAACGGSGAGTDDLVIFLLPQQDIVVSRGEIVEIDYAHRTDGSATTTFVATPQSTFVSEEGFVIAVREQARGGVRQTLEWDTSVIPTNIYMIRALSEDANGAHKSVARGTVSVEGFSSSLALIDIEPGDGATNVSRHTPIRIVFNVLLDSRTVDDIAIEVRRSGTFSTRPQGLFIVDRNVVIFDPTRTTSGDPNPDGLPPNNEIRITVRDFDPADPQGSYVRNLSGGALVAAEAPTVTFTTGD